ncbi:hypothetical protein [Microbulbifer pacificus]|uniref:hypothetical protein n=1 Tax=Microbulbifer pacificus TaxID=407164 RepID=UPI000CF54F8C|nr:hypothetical protein [Microbulbifer pacificus]
MSANKNSERARRNALAAGAAREALARRERNLDGETLSRLRRARSRALDQRQRLAGLWLPLGGVCAAALALALWLPGRGGSDVAAVESTLLADVWLLDEEAELEMIEDVEFYQWLAEEALDDRAS